MTTNLGYFRTPSIAGDAVVFLTEDDLWTVARTGGVARRLTANLGPVGRSIVSPDGEHITYTGTEEANAEVYLMQASGGPSRRVTYLGANTAARGWTPDGRVLFISDAGQPHPGHAYVYSLDPNGGVPLRLPFGPAMDVAQDPNGAGVVIGRHTVDPARWKRYRGGRRGDIWIDARGDGKFKRLVDLNSNLASPMWVGNRIYFLSDHEGIGNLYSSTKTGSDVRRHTDHDTYYARWAHSDGRRIVYQLAGEVWIYDPKTDTSERIDIDLRSPRIQRNRRFVAAAKFIHGASLHPDGHTISVAARGKLFTMPLWERAARQYGQRDGVRYRLPVWTHDAKSLVCVSDEGGDEALEIYDDGDPSKMRRLEGLDLGRAMELVPSPVADEVAITNHRGELIWVNLANGRTKVLDRSPHRSLDSPVWSPDGRFIAYACQTTRRSGTVKLAEPATGKIHAITRPDFTDGDPSFDPEGRYLYFLSARVFEPVPDQLFFIYGFPRAVRPYLVTLRADDPSPFVPKPKGFGAKPAGPKPDQANGEEGPAPVQIDLDGIEDRVVAFPMPVGRYRQIHGIKGKVLFTNTPMRSGDDDPFQTEPKPQSSLESYDLEELKHEVLVQGIDGFTVSADGATLLYRAARRWRALKAGSKPDPKLEREDPSRGSGWIDIGRIRPSVDPGSEWQQMFREAWRFQREHFWVSDMSGVDWDLIYLRYLPLVGKISSRAEFSDLMWEMNGELGTSHAYEMGGDVRPPPPYPVGHLAIDVALRDGRWTIEHIVRGDSWSANETSPLAAPGINVEEGDTIIALNGQRVTRDAPPGALLVHQSGMDAELLVGDERGRDQRTIVVKTLRSQMPARYREWVETNRREVHERTQGRVGYIHIPDMGAPGYAEFHRYFTSELERDGLVVDVRFNRGGNVSPLIIERLARPVVGYVVRRWGMPEPYGYDVPGGPMVCITNENAGSDGDIFSHVFKLRGLGPVVGKRTWGGVVGITLRHVMVDNGVTTQPEAAWWFEDVGWGVENYGTDPTHEVEITPSDHAAGRDPQMDTALRLISEALAKHKPVRPNLEDRPGRHLPALPARGQTTQGVRGSSRAKGRRSPGL